MTRSTSSAREVATSCDGNYFLSTSNGVREDAIRYHAHHHKLGCPLNFTSPKLQTNARNRTVFSRDPSSRLAVTQGRHLLKRMSWSAYEFVLVIKATPRLRGEIRTYQISCISTKVVVPRRSIAGRCRGTNESRRPTIWRRWRDRTKFHIFLICGSSRDSVQSAEHPRSRLHISAIRPTYRVEIEGWWRQRCGRLGASLL